MPPSTGACTPQEEPPQCEAPASHLEKSQAAVKTQHSRRKKGISGLEITERAPTAAASCLNPTASRPQGPALCVSLQKARPPDDVRAGHEKGVLATLYHLPAEFLSRWMVSEAPSHRATGKRSGSTALGAQHHLGGQRHKHWASNSAAGVRPQESVPGTRPATPPLVCAHRRPPRAHAQQLRHWCVPTGARPGHTLSIIRHGQPRAPGGCAWKVCTHRETSLRGLSSATRMAHVSLERKPSKGSHTRRPRAARSRPAEAFRGRRVRGRNNSGARGGGQALPGRLSLGARAASCPRPPAPSAPSMLGGADSHSVLGRRHLCQQHHTGPLPEGPTQDGQRP